MDELFGVANFGGIDDVGTAAMHAKEDMQKAQRVHVETVR